MQIHPPWQQSNWPQVLDDAMSYTSKWELEAADWKRKLQMPNGFRPYSSKHALSFPASKRVEDLLNCAALQVLLNKRKTFDDSWADWLTHFCLQFFISIVPKSDDSTLLLQFHCFCFRLKFQTLTKFKPNFNQPLFVEGGDIVLYIWTSPKPPSWVCDCDYLKVRISGSMI